MTADDPILLPHHRGRCNQCGWSAAHAPDCLYVQDRPTTLHPLIPVSVLNKAFERAEEYWQEIDRKKGGTAIRGFVWEAAPFIVAPLAERIAALESRLARVTEAGKAVVEAFKTDNYRERTASLDAFAKALEGQ